MTEKAVLLIGHYEKTYDITYAFWEQRNRLFLLLVVSIAIGTVFTYQSFDSQTILAALFANAVGITDEAGRSNVAESFTYSLLQSLVLSVVFFLTFNLYHRALYILRSYVYLEALETEIRAELSISSTEVAFSRESTFYWNDRPKLLGTVKYIYVILLGFLLASFLGGLLWNAYASKNFWLFMVDALISVPIAIYFIGYASDTIKFKPQLEQFKN